MRAVSRAVSAVWRIAWLAGAVMLASPAAADPVWINPGIGNWFAATNWSPEVVPTPADVPIVNNGGVAQAAAGTDITVGSFAIGSTSSPDISVSGTVEIGGSLTANFQSFVGTAGGSNSQATGVLRVGGTLTVAGATTVGAVFDTATDSAANGTIEVTGGDFNFGGSPFFFVGRATDNGSHATGVVSVPNGTLRSTFPSQFWEVGRAFGDATGVGLVEAAAVDIAPLNSLVVGVAGAGGTGQGTVTLRSGTLDIAGLAWVGVLNADQGGAANGSLALGTLRADGANRELLVGRLASAFAGPGTGRATGSITADGLENFASVAIGRADVHNGHDIVVSGTARIGAGGIVNTSGGGSLLIGRAAGTALNFAIVGPGAEVTGDARVGGDITGYTQVQIGSVVATGRAAGSLDLSNGTLATQFLSIGTVQGNDSGLSLTHGVTDAIGRLSVTDGAVVVTAPTQVGVINNPNAAIENSARGTVELTRSSLTGTFLSIGAGGGEGTVTATDGSTIEVIALSAGFAGGSGTVVLEDSTLTVRPDATVPGPAIMSVGQGSVTATRTAIAIDGALAIASLFDAVPNHGRVALVDSTLSVGASALVGRFVQDSRGELSLVNSAATIDAGLTLGQSANFGTLYGEALLEVRSSLLTIGDDLTMDPLAAPGLETIFGIDGLSRGLGGYGAIDATVASLAGLLTVDFTGLGNPGVSSAIFDLIVATSGILRDFDAVQFLGLDSGYYVSSYGIFNLGEDTSWRVAIAPVQVPEPATPVLLLSLLAGLTLARRRTQP